MIRNLAESFLYNLLPGAVLEFDERGLVWAVIGGAQDRLEDLRAYGRNLNYFFDATGALPQTGNNAVLVDLQSEQGVLYTRSLDILADTPPDGTTALTTWAAQQLNLDASLLLSVRYGVDLLRLVDTDVLGYLADSIGAVLFQSTLIPSSGEAAARQKLVATYFPRLKVKGTAQSFESLGKVLGFDDVLMKPLWCRVSPRLPADVGNAANDVDYSPTPEFMPQQTTGPFYDPLATRDGPFFTWVGTAVNGTASTQFYTTSINGFSPFITVTLLGNLAGTNVAAVTAGTVTHPASGSYALANGEPYTRAYVEPAGSSLRFNAIVQGAACNGLSVHVRTTGTVAVLTVTDRLSSLKYRASYFDLGLTADMDKIEEIYGAPSVKPNTDLMAGTNTLDGPAFSPYLPWVSGSIAGSLVVTDWLTSVDSTGSHLVIPRHEAAATDRQLNYTALVSAGVQVAQALEEVRPATRQPRYSAAGLLLSDGVPYARYGTLAALFTVTVPTTTYSGSDTAHPLGQFTAQVAIGYAGTLDVAEDASDPLHGTLWHYLSPTGLSGSYDFDAGSYYFNTALTPGSVVYAVYAIEPLDTEIIRPEPAFTVKFNGQTTVLPRPEDEQGEELDEVFDEFPWRRDIVGGGEVVEIAAYAPVANDAGVDPVSEDAVFSDQSGADTNVYAVQSSVTSQLRFLTQPRATDSTYAPGLVAVAYSGTFKNLATLSAAERDLVNVYTDFETLFEPGYAVYHAGVAQHVLVADLPKFYGPHHRDSLVGWLPCHEHVEDDLKVTDQAYGIPTSFYGVTFTDRLWSDERGWYLQLRPGSALASISERSIDADATLSFWLNLAAGTGGITTIVEYGALSFDLNEATGVVTGYVASAGVRLAVGSWLCSGWTFLYLRKSADNASFGGGSLTSLVVDSNAIAPFDSGAETLWVRGGTGRNYGLHDLRIWNAQKSEPDMNLVRYHGPTPTAVNYPVAAVYSVNRQDRYGLRVLPSGWLTTDVMPAWVRKPKLALVRRYDSMGSYSGESRFKEVGLGGGRAFPSSGSYVLGNVYNTPPATGTQIVAGSQGAMPGVSDYWLSDTGSGTYAFCGSTPLSNFVLDLSLNLTVIPNNTSGVAYSPVTDTLFVVCNGNSDIYEYDTSGVYQRTITTNLVDAESICWMYGSYFAMVEEKVADIVVFHIVPTTTSLLKTNGTVILPNFVPPGGYPGNDGLEGVSYDAVNDVFYVCKEQAAAQPKRSGMAVYRVEQNGTSTQPFYAPAAFGTISGINAVASDLADLFYDSFTDRLYVLSQETRVIIDTDLNGNIQQVVGYPASLTQPEGLTFNSDRTIMWIVGEDAEFRRYVKTVVKVSGTTSPWPNKMAETNPCREAVWLEGDDNYVWEVTLDGTESVRELKAERLFRSRSDTEIAVTPMYSALLSAGTYYAVTDTGWISGTGSNPATIRVNDNGTTGTNSVNLSNLVWSEQPTGARVILALNGTHLSVSATGSVHQVPDSAVLPAGTYANTPPLYLYQNSGIVAYATAGTGAVSALAKWTERGNTALDQSVDVTALPGVVSNGTLNVPARGNVGEITFLNQSGVLSAGVYRLKLESGNIGRVDADFTGFQVEITVNAKVMPERLLRNRSGFNIRGTDEFEFELDDDFTGDWFLTVFWSNPYSNPSTGTQRQLAIYSYELRKLATSLFRVDINPASTAPLLTLLSTSSYTPDTPGGWLVALNSYGTLSHATHESVVFPSNDTIASKHPLSDLLTGNTPERREDILLPLADVIITDEPEVVFGPIGTLTQAYYNEPLWMLSGGITPNPSVVIAAKMRHDSSQVRVAVSTDLAFTDPIYSDMKSASLGSLGDNNLVLKWRVPGLQTNGSYFYAVESDGSLYTTSTGTFRTWGTEAMDFNFGIGACENNLAGGTGPVVNNPIWAVCQSKDLHFFLHLGDFDYWNINAESPASYRLAYDLILSEASHRQAFLEIPFYYMYDDHDYSGNDHDKDGAGRDACLSVYREVVPHAQLPAGSGTNPSYYTFRVGRCQFIVTDLRSMRNPNIDIDSPYKSMMGTTQKAWWKQQVLQANADPTIGAIFWATTVPWTGIKTASADHWAGFDVERRELSDFLKSNSVTRFFMLHGDDHAASIDDGRYTDWATGTYGSAGTGHGWPLFGCSPLQQTGGSKGGTRFIGPSASGGTRNYFGHVAVRDDGTNVNVNFTAMGFNGTTVLTAGAVPIGWNFNGTESPRP